MALDKTDIDLDPIVQGADRVQAKKAEDVPLNFSAEEETQDTQTRANIHMGSQDAHGEGLILDPVGASVAPAEGDIAAVLPTNNEPVSSVDLQTNIISGDEPVRKFDVKAEVPVTSAGTSTPEIHFGLAPQTNVEAEVTIPVPAAGRTFSATTTAEGVTAEDIAANTAQNTNENTNETITENTSPVVGNVNLGATAEDTSVSFTAADLLANSSDVDGDSLSVTAVSVDSAYGTVTDNGDGSYSFTPTADYNGTDVPLSFTVSDGTSSSAGTASLDVTAVADAPTVAMSTELVGNHGQYDISAGGELTIDVSYFSVDAGYNSSHGYYVADSDGNPIGGAVMQDNVKGLGNKSVTIDTADYPGGVTLGFFIIPNGDNKNAGLADGDAVTFENIGGVWTPMHNGSALSGQGAPAYFSNQALNPDGFDHVADGAAAGNQNWEDLYGGGDQDFTDVNTEVTVTLNSHADLAVEGGVGAAIDLPDISYGVQDADGSETVTLAISGIPEGVVLEDGNGHTFTASAGHDTVDVSDWSLADLTVTPDGGSPDFALQVTATSTESSNGDTATTVQSISIEIADQTIQGVHGAEDLQGAGGDDTLIYNADSVWSGYVAHNVETGENVALSGHNRSSDVFDGGDGYDVVQGTSGDDAIFLDDGISGFASGGAEARIQNIEEIDMGAGNDIIDMTSNTYTYDQGIIVKGGDGNDTIWTSTGDDTLIGGAGDDSMFGGQGSDVFVFEANQGNDTVSGGDGGSWTDSIQLNGFEGSGSEQGWTLTLDGGSVISSTDESAHEMFLSEDASGTINFDGGGSIEFDGIEKISW